MKTISINQIILLLFICFLLFGDLQKLKQQTKSVTKQIQKFFKNKNKKKGT